MSDSTPITRYLLGELAEDEQAALEAQYVTDPQLFDRVARAESDLVDDYVRGKLDPEVRARFERVYLTPGPRRERVQCAEALLARIDRAEASGAAGRVPAMDETLQGRAGLAGLFRPKMALRFAFATLLVVSGVWLAIAGRRTQPEAIRREAARVEQERRDPTPAPGVAGNAPADPATPRPQSVVLLAFDIRSGVRAADTLTPTPLVVTPDATDVDLQLTLRERDYPTYRVIIRRVGGTGVFLGDQLIPAAAGSAHRITLKVPAAAFDSGDYLLTLQGATGVDAFEDLSRSLIRADRRP